MFNFALPSNILVGENLTAKVAHLGLAKMLPAEPNEGDSHVTTEVMGTLGYLDPEYANTGQLSVKSDVYSLGIVLLQLITRRRGTGIADLVKATLESGGIRRLKEELMDPLLRDSILVGFERFLRLALTCARKQGSQRPSMREVVKELESILDMDMDSILDMDMDSFQLTTETRQLL
jgi:serine/threonine protein kinase